MLEKYDKKKKKIFFLHQDNANFVVLYQ